MKTDLELIQCYQAGDDRALELLVKKNLSPVYHFVLRMTGSPSDAEEIAQDAFVKMWKNLGRFDHSKKFSTWLFQIAKNTALDYMRKRHLPIIDDAQNDVPDARPLPQTVLDQSELSPQLMAALATLSPDARTVVSLRHYDELTFREISEKLGEPLHTLKSRYRRALSRLKILLTKDF